MHGPIAVGVCAMCHNPHQSDFPKMLNAAGNAVCYICHTDKAETFKGKKFMHNPVKEQCTGCHNPHVSDYVKQLVKQPVDTCMMCHDKPLDTPGGRIINMKEYLARNREYHSPIQQNDCSACHNTHGSDNFRILRKYFPQAFYASFDPKNYELCFNCHEKTLVLDPKTTTLTGFRNGDQNLHFVHVNKEVKGRTCRACHDAHATNNPKHIRDAVPFGAWGLPVGFVKTEDGGSCLPGCHQKFEYRRTAPAKNR